MEQAKAKDSTQADTGRRAVSLCFVALVKVRWDVKRQLSKQPHLVLTPLGLGQGQGLGLWLGLGQRQRQRQGLRVGSLPPGVGSSQPHSGWLQNPHQ